MSRFAIRILQEILCMYTLVVESFFLYVAFVKVAESFLKNDLLNDVHLL